MVVDVYNKCTYCEKEGKLSQYPGNIAYSDCWCDECYVLEKNKFSEWKEKTGKKPPGFLIPFLRKMMPESSDLVNFYLGNSTGGCYRIEEIWTWSDDKLEAAHDYIQWLFPLKEPSNFNPNAPIVTEKEEEDWRKNVDLHIRLMHSAKIFLAFLGLKLQPDIGTFTVKKADNFEARKSIWQVPNHNWLRVTRMLASLRLLSHSALSVVIYNFLVNLRQEESIGSENSFQFWKEAAGQ